jgi:hypothetical protein
VSSTWPLVEISHSFSDGFQREIDRLVRLGLSAVSDVAVEVHVRARHPRVRWVVYAAVRRSTDHRCVLRPLSSAQRSRDLAVGIPVPAVAGPLLTGWATRRADLAAELAAHAPLAWERRVAWARDTVGGRTFCILPEAANGVLRLADDAGFLVTLQVPLRLDRGDAYPRDIVYKKTVPVTVLSWQEEILHVAAHEARHVWQHVNQRPRSETDAERWALATVAQARTVGSLLRPATASA